MFKLFEFVNRLVVKPCMVEDESYAIRSRKLCTIAVCVLSFNALLTGLPITIIDDRYNPSIGVYITAATMFLVTFTTSIFPYAYLRYTKTLPGWLVELQVWTALLCTASLLLFIHQGSVTIVGTCVALMGLILRVKAWPLAIFVGLLFNVLHALINDFEEELPKLHETFYTTQLLSVRIMYIFGSNVTPFLCFAAGLHIIMMEFVRYSEQANAAIAMNLAVADKLRLYDTDGVAEILAANEGKVDGKLLAAFTAIQHNLQEYRPHIPDYVIASSLGETSKSETNGNDDDDEGDIYISTGDFTNSTVSGSRSNIFRNPDLKHNGGSGQGPSDSLGRNGDTTLFTPPPLTFDFDHPSPVLVARNTSDDHCPNVVIEGSLGRGCEFSRPEGAGHQGASSLTSASLTSEISDGRGTTTDREVKSSASHVSRKLNKSILSTSRSQHHFFGRATTVFVRFVSAPCGSDGIGNGSVSKGSAASAMSILSKCIDAGSKLAKTYGGALQYMQGCGLMVSFNAASRVVVHESKACAFALGLKGAVDDIQYASIVMHASIVTTNVLSFFAGNTGQLMLTVLGGFMPIHTAMHHYLSQTVGKEASCVLLSDTVVPAIEMMYEHRLLGASVLTRSDSDTPQVIVLSQLVSNAREKGGDGDNEWMYKLAQRQLKTPLQRELGVLIQRLVSQRTFAGVDGSSDGAATTTPDGRTELIQRSTIQALLPQIDPNDTVLKKCVKERLLSSHTTTPSTTTSATDYNDGFVVNVSPVAIW